MTATTTSQANISLAELVDRLTRLVAEESDEQIAAFIADHAGHAEELHKLLPMVRSLVQIGERAASAEGGWEMGEDAKILGDYRIVREIGRGGMGIVYEAEQLSLRRRVALKVLPFAAVLDPRHLQRFKNEAFAAASLDHPNIVEVHAVGCERGVHFYAMRYVEGQTLAAVIDGLKCGMRSAECGVAENSPNDGPADTPNSELQTPNSADTVAAALSTLTDKPLNPRSSILDPSSRDFFRIVAELGIQAAEALDHAHQMGIVHRDIKPSNLMVEVGRGARIADRGPRAAPPSPSILAPQSSPPHLFITDFGLARIESDAAAGLTMTGDLLGTLRYMSPEQAEGKSAVLDHRTDIYSLGITLYELLTGRPAFPANDRQTLLRQITDDEPISPRKINTAISHDLETIVLKAIAKSPDERYATARELADDLDHLLRSEPIRARRATPLQRIARWSRRHRGLVAAAAILLAVTAGLAIAAAVLFAMERDRTIAALTDSDHQRTRAEASLSVARRAVDDMYTKVGTLWLAEETAPSIIQRDLISRALEVYEELAKDPPTDAASRRNAAAAFERIGEIQHFLGQKRAAAEALQRSIDLDRDLATGGDTSDDLLAALAARHRKLAQVEHALAEWSEAQESYTAGLNFADSLVDRAGGVSEHRFEVALYRLLGADFAARAGRLEEAAKLGRRVAKDLTALITEDRERLDWQVAQCKAQLLIVDVVRRLGRLDEAQKQGTQTLDRIQAIMRHLFHDARELVQLEAEAHEQLASVTIDLGRPEVAAGHLREALLLKQQNLRGKQRPFLFELEIFSQKRNMDEGREPVSFCSYAETQLRLAQVLLSLDRPYEAERLLGESVCTGYFLCSMEPGPDLRYMLHYGNAWSAVADFVTADRPQEAEHLQNAADTVWRAVVAYFPQAIDHADLPREVRNRLDWHRRHGAARIPAAELEQSYRRPPALAWKTAFMERALFFPFNHSEPTAWETADGARMRATGRVDDWFYIAMAHERLGKHEEAQQWLQHAIESLGDKPHIELVELRAEAEELLSKTGDAKENGDAVGKLRLMRHLRTLTPRFSATALCTDNFLPSSQAPGRAN
ncbi:MAG: serine/threonine-protein kinase [Pirellulales bacterium]